MPPRSLTVSIVRSSSGDACSCSSRRNSPSQSIPAPLTALEASAAKSANGTKIAAAREVRSFAVARDGTVIASRAPARPLSP